MEQKTTRNTGTPDERRPSIQETLVYVLLWSFMFVMPVAVIQFHHASDTSGYPWRELFQLWRQIFIYLACFLIHNYLLAPLIVYRKRHVLYFSCITVLLGCFVMAQCMNQPEFEHRRGPHAMADHKPYMMHHPCDSAEAMAMPMHEMEGDRPPMPPHDHGPHDRFMEGEPPMVIGLHEVLAVVMFVLMLGMNLGVRLYFRQREDEQRMASLERQNLEQQLDFLRYQINPHFLMNTLNNIHALVDIDPDEAKETIVGFSKILRYVLYDGSKQMVSLDRELNFLKNYIDLMALRVAEQVDLVVELPTRLPDAQVPPLLFITFVENAFKHGVSYQHHSFIDIHCSIDGDRLHFTCRNSKVPKESVQNGGAGGVGLRNARQRLDLIYGNRYQLDITEDGGTYGVSLVIPMETSANKPTTPQQS